MYELSGTDLEKHSIINAIIEIDIFDYDLTVARKNSQALALNKNQRKTYLRKTGYYKLPEEKLDSNLISQSFDEVERAQQIYDFVVEQLQDQTFFGEAKGNSKEYADLMTALARYNNIPARRVSGYTVKMDTTGFTSKVLISTGHAWAEYYLDDLGWVPFDPIQSDEDSKVNFNNLTNKYIYLRFDELDKGISWKRWGLGNMQIELERKVRLK